MKQVFRYNILILLFLPIIGFGQYTAEKIINESVAVENGAEFKVDNRYGDITINGWDQNSIEIKIMIEVKKKSKGDAEELLRRINPVISNFGRYVGLKVEVEEKNTGFFAQLLSEVTIDFDKSDIEIDLDIKLPKSTELEITNEFGDVVLTDWTGKLRCNLRHGDLHVTDSIGYADINQEYGRANFYQIENAEIKLRNARLKADKITDLRLNSSGSEVDIRDVAFLIIDSNKDEVNVDHVKRLKGEFNFGTVFIKQVDDEVFLDLKVTDFRLSKVLNPNASIYVNQQSSEVDITITGIGFKLDADLEGGVFRLPESVKDVDSQVLDEKSNSRKIHASFGTPSDGRMTFVGKKGFVILREL